MYCGWPVNLQIWTLAKREALLIAVLVIVALVMLAVIHLGTEIGEDGTSRFDSWLILSLRQPGDLGVPIGPAWLRPVMVDITALGGVTLLLLVVTAAVGYLMAAARYRNALLLLVATVSGTLLVVKVRHLVPDHVATARRQRSGKRSGKFRETDRGKLTLEIGVGAQPLRHPPNVAGRVTDTSLPIPIRHVSNIHNLLAARRQRLLHRDIGISDVEVEGGRACRKLLRRFAHHDRRGVELHLAVSDAPVRSDASADLSCAECGFKEAHIIVATINKDVRRHHAEAIWNMHRVYPF
jgi:hypothetical protein